MSPTNSAVDDGDAVRLARLLLRAAVPNTIVDLPPPAGQAPTAASDRRIGWLERLARWTARLRQRERERHLAQSTDIFDLERRIRAIEQRPYY